MKAILYLLLALISFALTVVGMLAYTGDLNKEGLDKLMGWNQPEAPIETKPEPDELSEMAKALQERENELDAREEDLGKQQQRLNETQDQMEELRNNLKDLIAQLTQSVDTIDADTQARLQDVADSLAGMKPDSAALVLEEYPPNQGARLLQLIDERARGKILDKMNEKKAAEFLQALSDRNEAKAQGKP